jgi:hypothetical protein
MDIEAGDKITQATQATRNILDALHAARNLKPDSMVVLSFCAI